MEFLYPFLKTCGAYIVVYLVLILHVRGQATLYSFDEPIVQLTSHNFSMISNTENAWLVEFYATWCGHCRRFAPTFSELARDIQSWHKVIKVAAIACSDQRNTPLCQYYQIWGYPTVKFFPPYAGFHTGFLYHGDKTVDSLRTSAIHFLTVTLQNKPGSWPWLNPLRSVDQSWLQATPETKIAFIMYEDGNGTDYESFIGRELILDFSSNPDVILTRVVNPVLIQGSGVETPALYQVSPEFAVTPSASGLSREGFRSVINSLIQELTTKGSMTSTPTPDTTTHIQNYSIPDGTHMQDLESALVYSLWVEVATHPNITGDTFRALTNYISVLAKYFPGESYHTGFLERVHAWLRIIPNLTGKRWQHMISTFRECGSTCDKTYDMQWVGCQGSVAGLRGYPCGLWTLFHTITVQAYNQNHQSDTYQPLEVLITIRDYVKHFLGCRECAGHFLKMAAHISKEVVTPEDGVLWLWKAHNKANRRLAGDPTQDPEHPKVQFPSLRACPICRISQEGWGKNISIEWNMHQVFTYLKQFYGSADIFQDTQPNNFFKILGPYTTEKPTTPSTPSPTNSTCRVQSSAWDRCSRSCGAGISVRMSNDNERCRMEMETRLCLVKQCQRRKSNTMGKKSHCSGNPISSRSQFLRLGNCRTLQRTPQCNSCGDQCCYSTKDHTVWLKTVCSTRTGHRNHRYRGYSQVMWIDECTCSAKCPEE